jgi:hypothetical protein
MQTKNPGLRRQNVRISLLNEESLSAEGERRSTGMSVFVEEKKKNDIQNNE